MVKGSGEGRWRGAVAGSGPRDVERGLLQRSMISHLAPGSPCPSPGAASFPSYYPSLSTFKQTPLFLCCLACLPKPVGSPFSWHTGSRLLVTLLSWELGSSLETSRSLRSCVLTLLGPRSPRLPSFRPQPQKSRSQFSSSRLATGTQLFSSSQELEEEGNRPPPVTRADTPLPTHPSTRPWLSQPPAPAPPRTRVPGLSQLPGSPRLNRDGVGGGGRSRRLRRKGREPPSPSRVFPSLS